MSDRRRFALTLAVFALPWALGSLVAALIASSVLPNLIFLGRYEFDLAWVASVVGTLGSVTVLALVSMRGLLRRTAQRARQREQADQAGEQRRFLRRLDHELKNPLTIVRLGVTNLQDSPNLTDEQKASLGRVEQQTQRLMKLVTDLRALTELEERELEKRPLDLRQILQDAIETSDASAGPSPVALRLQEVPWPVGRVLGDRDLLVAAIRNLLDNARKFMHEDGQIEVHATDDGRLATVEIADTGIGIPASEIEHVFEELYRGRNAQGIAGSGLGLTLVQRIVALHGGTVAVRSREGQGTVVTIRLPLVPD